MAEDEQGVEVEVTQEMLDTDPSLVEKGFSVGDKVTRAETDEEREAREKGEAEANEVPPEGEVNGERHPLA